jgi:hypothetical protein
LFPKIQQQASALSLAFLAERRQLQQQLQRQQQLKIGHHHTNVGNGREGGGGRSMSDCWVPIFGVLAAAAATAASPNPQSLFHSSSPSSSLSLVGHAASFSALSKLINDPRLKVRVNQKEKSSQVNHKAERNFDSNDNFVPLSLPLFSFFRIIAFFKFRFSLSHLKNT